MHNTNSYIMRDQVKDVVPKLMDFDAREKREDKNNFKELIVFLLAAMGYLLALGLMT